MYEKSREKEEIYADEPFCRSAESQSGYHALQCDRFEESQRQEVPSRLFAAGKIAFEVRLARRSESRVL